MCVCVCVCVCVWFLQLVPSDFFGPNFSLKNFLFVIHLNLCTKKKVKLKPLTEFVSQKLFHRPYNVVIIKWIWCGQAHEGVIIQDFSL